MKDIMEVLQGLIRQKQQPNMEMLKFRYLIRIHFQIAEIYLRSEWFWAN